MKRLLSIIALLMFFNAPLFGAPVYEIGTWKSRDALSGEFKAMGGFVTREGHLTDDPMKESLGEPNERDVRRFFHVDDKGFVVVGDDVPQKIKTEVRAGDLVVNGTLYVSGSIRAIGPSLSSVESAELTSLRQEVAFLRKELSVLTKSLRK